jgi:molybdopterin-guanine dinucleotide biosynthesis protein A
MQDSRPQVPDDRAVPFDEGLREQLAIAVLAGGRSERMGQDKAWIEFGGRSLLRLVLDAFVPLGVPLLVAAGSPERSLPPLPPGVELCFDSLPGAGPLQGLEAIFAALPAKRDLLLVVTCDAPFVSGRLALELAARLGDADAAVPHSEGRRHGLCALYRRRCAQALQQVIESGRRSVQAWLDRLELRAVDEAELRDFDPELRCLLNLNTPEELEAALKLAGREARKPGENNSTCPEREDSP